MNESVKRDGHEPDQAGPVLVRSERDEIAIRRRHFFDIDERRATLGAPYAEICRRAALAERSYRRILDGDRNPAWSTIAKLRKALAAIEREMVQL